MGGHWLFKDLPNPKATVSSPQEEEYYTARLIVRYPEPKMVSVRTLKPPFALEEMEEWERQAWLKSISERPEVIEVSEAEVYSEENLIDITATTRPAKTIGVVSTGGLWEIKERTPAHMALSVRLEMGDEELIRTTSEATRRILEEELTKKPFCLPSLRRIDCSVEKEVPREEIPKIVDSYVERLRKNLEERLKVETERKNGMGMTERKDAIIWSPRFMHPKKNEGTCAICDREHVSLVRHHLIPKDPKSPFDWVCKPCANQIHVLFTNVELKQVYNTIEKIKSAPRMQKFIKWLRREGEGEKWSIGSLKT